MKIWVVAALALATGCADDAAGTADAGSAADTAPMDAAVGADAPQSLDGVAPDVMDDVGADTDVQEAADVIPGDVPATPDVVEDTVDSGSPPEDATTDTAQDAGVDIGADTGPLDPATVPLRGSCPQEERVGGFLVEAQELFSIVDGKVANGVDPNTVQEVVKSEGGCTLLRTEYPVCDPLCDPGFTCAKDIGCVPYPLQQDLGTVTIEGLEKLVVMDAKPPSNSYFDTELPQPAFLPGKVIHLTSTAGYAGEMEMFGVGSSPIEVVDSSWVVVDGQPLAFAWDPPPEGARTQVQVRVTLDQHGNTPVSLLCELPDTGAAQIPAALISELLGYGISGFPNARVSRRTVDSITGDKGCIDFVVGAPRSPSVTVSGHYPCSMPGDCPDGLTCNVPMETCE